MELLKMHIRLFDKTRLFVLLCIPFYFSFAKELEDKSIPVYAIKIKNQPFEEKQTLVAEIMPRYLAHLSFRVDGKIIERKVVSGQHVEKGQELALLVPSDYRLMLEANEEKVKAAEAEAKQAIADENRFKNLSRLGALSNLDYARQKTLADRAKAQLALAEKELALARNNLKYTTLRAPFSGIISNVTFEVGDIVGRGQPLAIIYEEEHLDAVVDIPQDLIKSVNSDRAIILLPDIELMP